MMLAMIEAAARALLFALVVGAALRLFRVSNVPVSKAAWTLVLIASLAMPFLMRSPAVTNWNAQWSWAVPVPVRWWTPDAPRKPIRPLRVHAAPVVLAAMADDSQATPAPMTKIEAPPVALSVSLDATPVPAAAPIATSRHAQFQWPPAARLVVMIYLGVAGILILRLVWGLAMALRLWATADLVSPLTAPEPNVRSSSKIPSPVTIGSGIVLPANYIEWDRRKLRMVLAHERSHVRQLDFYLQLLAGLYTALFWFSPLGWWLRRTLASLGEAIGDRAGMDAAASRSRYAEVLLEFANLPRQALPGVAMARPGNLSHRVERLLNENLFHRAFAEGRRRAFVSLLIIPAALFAATVLVRVPRASAQTAPPAAPAPAAPARPATPESAPVPTAPGTPAASAAPEETVEPGTPAVAPQAPVPPAVPGVAGPALAPVAPMSGLSPTPAIAPLPPDPADMEVDDSPETMISDDDQDSKGYTYGFSDKGESYAVVEGSGNDVTFSGSWDSQRRAEIDAARKVAKGPFLWFTHYGKSYVVTDPAIIARIRAMYQPMEELGRKQAALGKQQEAFGKQMEELAREQEEAGQMKMPDMSKEMAQVDAALAKLKENRYQLNVPALAEAEAKLKGTQDKMLTPEKMAALQAELAAVQAQWNSDGMAAMQARLGELQARLGELQGEAGARQGDFGAKMGELGAQQGKLGGEQGRLGAEQGRIARQADRQVRGIIEDCLRNGKASQVPQVK